MNNALSAAKSSSTVSNEFLNQFESFTIQSNPSPVPSQYSSTSSAFTTSGGLTDQIKEQGSLKSKSNTPIPLNASTNTSSSLFDNFADFDTFSKTKSSTSTLDSTKKSCTPKPDPFLDAFNDNFETRSNKSIDSNSNQVKNTTKSTSSLDVFDAFAGKNTTASTVYNAFGDNLNQQQVSDMFGGFNDNNFEDDFFKNSNLTKDFSSITLKETNLNKNNTKTNKSPLPFNDNDFTKFDAFSEMNDDFNNSTVSNLNNAKQIPKYSFTKSDHLTKVQNKLTVNNNTADKTTENGAKLPKKFVADYSKPETFDDDLQEAIKRSMVDQ